MSERILKRKEVEQTTGLSGPTIYRLASKSQFPKPIKLGERSSGWLKSEVDTWIEERIQASRKE